MRIKIDDTPLKDGNSYRGMGFYAINLIECIKRSKKVELVNDNYDLVHYPYFDLFANTLKVKEGEKTVVTVPDVIPLLYPNAYPLGIKAKINFLKQKNQLRKVDAVITISETSKKDIVRFLKIPQEKVHVTYLGPGNNFTNKTKKINLPKKFILYVGDINWNKNLINFAKAINDSGLEAVVVGKNAKALLDNPEKFDFSHGEQKHLKELRHILLNSKNIQVLGFLENEEISYVYKKATLYCQPSFYEGFGLPLIEAMEAGIPIVSTKTQALVEVADNAAIYFDPNSIEDISEKLRNVMEDNKLRMELISKGKERVKLFSWSETAIKTIDVYKNI